MVQIIATLYDLAFRATLVDSQSPSILVRSRKSPGIHVDLRVVDVLFPATWAGLVIVNQESQQFGFVPSFLSSRLTPISYVAGKYPQSALW